MSVLVGLAIPAGAATPNTNITGTGAAAVFSPTSLSVGITTGTCTTTNDSFTISNPTKKSATITLEVGTKFKKYVVLKPNFFTAICATATGTATFSLKKNKAAVLTVTVS